MKINNNISLYKIHKDRLMLGKNGKRLSSMRMIKNYIKELKSYEYKRNVARGSNSHYVDKDELEEWNRQVIYNIDNQ